jgi:PAS domain S-box-containing protein
VDELFEQADSMNRSFLQRRVGPTQRNMSLKDPNVVDPRKTRRIVLLNPEVSSAGRPMDPASKLAVEEKACKWFNEGLYRHIFLEVPLACFSVGVDGLVRAANKQALGLVGYRLSDILGRPVFDLYADTPAGKATAERQFLRFRSGAEVHYTGLEMRHADGASVWITLSVKPIRDRTGRVIASCSVVEEIAEQLSPGQSQSLQDRDLPWFGSDVGRSALVSGFRPAQEFPKRFLIKSVGSSFFVKVEDIDWVAAAGNYVELHIGSKSHLMRKTMIAVESRLDPQRFLRVHRSAIVNVERIKELRPWRYGDRKIVLFGGTQLILKRSYTEKLGQILGELY